MVWEKKYWEKKLGFGDMGVFVFVDCRNMLVMKFWVDDLKKS